MRILGISGSVRRDSFNRKLLLSAAELAPEEVEVVLFDDLKLIPPFDEDDEPLELLPGVVADLRQAIADSDGLLFATPEYNASIPGQLKNAVDWASRPVRSSALRGKPAAVVGASTGAFGAVWAQAELRKVLGTAGARVVDGEVAVGHAPQHFDDRGRLTGEEVRSTLGEVVETLVVEARAAAERRSAALLAA
jgi:chromate reductase